MNCDTKIHNHNNEFNLFKKGHSYANQGSSFPGPFENNANKVDDAVDPFSPKVRTFDPFDDEFSKPSSTFDFSFSKGKNRFFFYRIFFYRI